MTLAQALMNAKEQANGTVFAIASMTAEHGLFQAEMNKDMVLMVFGRFPENDTATWRRHTFLLWEPEWLTAMKNWEWHPFPMK